MARTLVKYVFAALLALLSTQAVAPSQRVTPAIEIVRAAKIEQRTPREVLATHRDVEVQAARPVATYVSRIEAEPDLAVLFQRPPPTLPLFS